MKTVREWAAVRRLGSEEARAAQRAAFRALLDALPDASVHSSPAAPAIREAVRRDLRLHADGERAGRISLLDLACDHCGTRLVDVDVGTIRPSSPPRFRAACPGCGWDTYLTTDARSS